MYEEYEENVQKIIKHIEDYYFEPRSNWPDYYFIQRSYSIWAVNELLADIISNPLISTIDIINNFIIKMEVFSQIKEDTTASYIFSIAKEVGEDILKLISRIPD